MTILTFLSKWINKQGEIISVNQLDRSGKEYEIIGPKKSVTKFFGSYPQLLKKLKSDGYQSRTRHEETETIDNFMDKILSETKNIKAGQKKIIEPKDINLELSDEAKAVLLANPENAEKREKLKELIKKHEDEYNRLKSLLNQIELEKSNLRRQKDEIPNSPTEDQLKYFMLIEKECSEFLKHVKATDTFLYRGMDNDAPVLVGKPHLNREPKDTKSLVQTVVDKNLKMMGFKALRSNSIFTTSDYAQACRYGYVVYLIFPKNGYHFTWSKHHDWIPEMIDLIDKNDKNVLIVSEVGFAFDNLHQILVDFYYTLKHAGLTWFKKNNLTQTEVEKLLQMVQEDNEDNDIMRKMGNYCYDFYKEALNTYIFSEIPKNVVDNAIQAFDFFQNLEKKMNIKFSLLQSDSEIILNNFNNLIKNNIPIKDITDVSKESAQNFVKKHDLNNTDIEKALKKQNEIYINGEYIALRENYFINSAFQYFLKHEPPRAKTKIDLPLKRFKGQ